MLYYFCKTSEKSLIGLLVSLLLVLLGSGPAWAQQPDIELDALTVELWPEFDRPEVLVIYRAELAAHTPLPAEVAFRFPGYVEMMHAVAVERSGGLYSVDPDTISVREDGDDLLVFFTADSHQIHLEYYDSHILDKAQDGRKIDLSFTPDYSIDAATFQVQIPLGAEQFTLRPQPTSHFTSQDGFVYQSVEVAGLAPGDTVEIEATYSRETDRPSAQLLAAGTTGRNAGLQVVTDEAPASTSLLPYLLIGASIGLLLLTGGYWLWTVQAKARPSSAASERTATSPPVREAPFAASSTGQRRADSGDEFVGYCAQCGTALRTDSIFCHVCGTRQRTM